MSGEIWSDITSRPAQDAKAEPVVSRVETPPLPASMRSVAITGMFVLAIFYTLYFTGEIAIPLAFAVLFKLLLQPGVRLLARLKVPQPLSALAMIVLLFAVLGRGGYFLAGAVAGLPRTAPPDPAPPHPRSERCQLPLSAGP